ncbi:PREDICTED: glycerate kinase [Dinoponera quadriceps]|uniref:Glycerate kinase n=1 Tax=Dinoponera quadriceps TaxID=609295 RepID=A0A6P3XDU2_DINQU|nr:PREDICTED: glycerate kinase [Dinoponera quadriceps]
MIRQGISREFAWHRQVSSFSWGIVRASSLPRSTVFLFPRYSETFHPNLTKFPKRAGPRCCGMATRPAGFLSDGRRHLTDLFRAAVKAVSPNEIIRRKVRLRDDVLYVNNERYPLGKNVYLVGFGKAVMGMAVELERILGDVLKKGILSIPSRSLDAIWESEDKSSFPKLHDSVIEYREGGVDNQPNGESLEATHRIIDLVENLTNTDTLIVLVSGGGSALLYMPRPVLDHEDKLQLCRKLQNAGAGITELNVVRRKLSLVKGGGLARMAHPASVITLILSDIINDPVDLIASGPTVYNAKAPEEIAAVLRKYNLYQSLDGDLKKVLTSKETHNDAPLLNTAGQFKHVTNIIVGNNTMAVEAASREALRKGFTPIILRNDVQGDVRDVAAAYVRIASSVILAMRGELSLEDFCDRVCNEPTIPLDSPKSREIYRSVVGDIGDIVLIGGGEPTVRVTGEGKGGRNQELAASFSLSFFSAIRSRPTLANCEVMMLSAGTDGQDGPTDAAGAFGYPAIAPVTYDLRRKVQAMLGEKFAPISSREAMKYARTITDEGDTRDPSCEKPGTNNAIDPRVLTMMEAERMLIDNTLANNDTYNFYSRFKRGADLLKTGLTGTNVMDLHLIYIRKEPCESAISDEVTQCERIFDAHDLRADATTVAKYKTMQASLQFDEDEDLTAKAREGKPPLNIRIVDKSLTDPCCDKNCKQ